MTRDSLALGLFARISYRFLYSWLPLNSRVCRRSVNLLEVSTPSLFSTTHRAVQCQSFARPAGSTADTQRTCYGRCHQAGQQRTQKSSLLGMDTTDSFLGGTGLSSSLRCRTITTGSFFGGSKDNTQCYCETLSAKHRGGESLRNLGAH